MRRNAAFRVCFEPDAFHLANLRQAMDRSRLTSSDVDRVGTGQTRSRRNSRTWLGRLTNAFEDAYARYQAEYGLSTILYDKNGEKVRRSEDEEGKRLERAKLLKRQVGGDSQPRKRRKR